jgi:allophanate hydrolase
LGTDTAGSGRIPAMMNNIIGLKPTRGLLSTRGVIPACRSLDCVSIFAETIADAALVLSIARGFDEFDPYSRSITYSSNASPWIFGSKFRFGVPTNDTREFFGDNENPILYQKSIDKVAENLGGQFIEFDLKPFLAVANLLYKGPWVAERYAAVGHFIDEHENEVDPIVYSIIKKSKNYLASDLFNAQYELEKLKKKINLLWENFDLIIVPTAPRTYTIDQINASPIEYNSNLGYYTNFVNLLDLSAISIPAGFRSDGLPFSITIISHALTDIALLLLGDRIHRLLSINLSNSKRLLSETPKFVLNETNSKLLNCFLIGVVGAHLQGQPLNYQLTQRNGRFVRTCRTNNQYRLYALNDSIPPKPGLLYVKDSNQSGIEIEIWALPNDTLSSFIQLIPSPLSIGNIHLEDGQIVKGFLVEQSAIDNALDITHFGGWINYLNFTFNQKNI